MTRRLFSLFSVIVFSFLTLGLSLSSASYPVSEQNSTNLPHFFPPGVISTLDPATQWEAYLRYLMATDHCHGVLGDKTKFIVGSNAIRQKVKIAGKETALILDPYVRNPDGTIVFTSYCGQEKVTEAQLKTVIDYLTKETTRAVELNWSFYSDIERETVKERAAKLGIPENEFRTRLDKPSSRYKDIMVRDEHFLPPAFEEIDFVPRELHLGYFPEMAGSGVIAAAWLNSGMVYVTMQSLVLDYLTSKPLVLMHELIHANKKLQKLPLSEGFNVELFASVPEMLLDEDKLSLWFHHYIEPLREIVWIHFGFDFKQARKEVIRADLAGNIFIDRDKFIQYTTLLDQAKPQLRATLKKAIIEFYSDAPGWVAFNDKLQNDYAVIDLMFAKDFDLCVRLTESQNCNATMKWLRAHEDKIREIAKKAFEKSGTSTLEDVEATSNLRLPSQPILKMVKSMFPQIREADVAAFLVKERVTPAELVKMDGIKLTALFRKFLATQERR